MTNKPLEKWMRYALFASVPLNVVGSAAFFPLFPGLRSQLGFPDGPSFYLYLVSVWILIFGFCYLYMAMTQRRDRIFAVTAGLGKLSFCGLLVAGALVGTIPVSTAISGVIDFILGLIYVVWFWKTRNE